MQRFRSFLPFLKFVFLLFPVLASAQVTEESVKKWLPKEASRQLIEATVKKCNEEVSLMVETEDADKPVGKSFSGVNPFRQHVLEAVRKKADETGTRVRVLDLGAGHGNMTWKLILAGAHVTALEKQPPTADLLKATMGKHASLFRMAGWNPSSDGWPSILRLMKGDYLAIKESAELEDNQFDFIWSGQNIHFFNPSQLKVYADKIHSQLKHGGIAFISTLSPYSHETIPELIETQRRKGSRFPGYHIENQLDFIGKTYTNNLGRTKPFRAPLNQVALDEDVEIPVSCLIEGLYGPERQIVGQAKQVLERIRQQPIEIPHRLIHTASMLFDERSLGELFVRANLEFKEIFHFAVVSPPNSTFLPLHFTIHEDCKLSITSSRLSSIPGVAIGISVQKSLE